MLLTTNYTEFQILGIKDYQSLLQVSKNTAQQYYSDTKKQFHISKVTYSHFKSYFKIP